jgi:hypothetical protein
MLNYSLTHSLTHSVDLLKNSYPNHATRDEFHEKKRKKELSDATKCKRGHELYAE